MLEEDRAEAEATLDDTVQGALRDLNLDWNNSRAPPSGMMNGPPQPHTTQPPFKAAHSKLSRHRGSVASHSPSMSSTQDPQDLLVDLKDAPVRRLDQDGFRPIAGFKFSSSFGEGAPSSKTCLAMSDIGFFAASNEANLIVVDMRGPEVLLFDSPHSQTIDHKGKGKHKVDPSSISSLTWTISAIGEGRQSPLSRGGLEGTLAQNSNLVPQTETIRPA